MVGAILVAETQDSSLSGRQNKTVGLSLQNCLLLITSFISGYFFSTWILDLYRRGDQEHYNIFWQSLLSDDPVQWISMQARHLSSGEPLYSIIIGIGVYFDFERIPYISIWNGIFVSIIVYILLKFRSSLIFSSLLLSNYYILVLITSAERLKFSYILLALAFISRGIVPKLVLSALSVLTHTQAIAQFASSAIYYAAANHKELFASKTNALIAILGTPIAVVTAGYFLINSAGDIITEKVAYYGQMSEGAYETLQWGFILACGLVVFNKKAQYFLGMLPMGLLTSMYGNRINVATLAFFCALALSQRKTSHPFVLVVMTYMSFKSIGFIQRVLETGQGFDVF